MLVLLETDFDYVSHWSVCTAEEAFPTLGTRSPAALAFASAAGAAQLLAEWWPSQAAHCRGARLLLVLIGAKAPSLASQGAQALAEGLVTSAVNFVELRTPQQAAVYAVQCAEAVVASRKRGLPSRFKAGGLMAVHCGCVIVILMRQED
ncbi:unnamed protein product [Effrenium voratum]|nr:unnamed protein product [Effrenium voratum]